MPGRPFEIEISNFELIEACWGSVVADQVVGHIQARLHGIGLGFKQQDARCRFRIISDARTGGPVDWDQIADLSYRLTVEPIAVASATTQAGTAIHAVMTWYRDDPPRYRAPRDIQRDHGERWFAMYKSDMQIVARTFCCAADGRMTPHWQPVCDFRDPSRVLYHEGLVRFCDQGDALTPALVFPALERTGMAGTFDWLMVRRVIAELQADPSATLGVNISASSAHVNGWWRGILADLETRPDVASRLVVEITETEPIVHICETVAFARQVRAIGATVALDDFGAGYTSIRQLMDLVPALVKIDGLFLQRALNAVPPCHSLPHLIGLIRELGGTVVIEGVETAEMADLAFVSGALWQQGYHYGRPAPARVGRSGALDLTHIAAEANG